MCWAYPFLKSRRLELMKERERRKEEEVEALKRSMQAGLVGLIVFLLSVDLWIYPWNINWILQCLLLV